MSDSGDPFDVAESDSRRDGHKKSKTANKGRKPSYSRKGRKRDDESPTHSPTRRDDVDLSSLEIISPTGSILHQHEATQQGKRLDWSHKVTLSAEKVQDPAIYTCEICNLPILIYGRLIPCKHVFCFDCAKNQKEKNCPRCKDPFTRIEQSALGTVFICTYGGGKQTPRGCKRTYLSQRDLNAHITHRHKKSSNSGTHVPPTSASSTASAPSPSSSAKSVSNPISQQIASSLPGNIDLTNLNNITDAQLKAAADILAATINAGKPGTGKPEGTLEAPAAATAPAGTAYPPLSHASFPPSGPPPPLVSGQIPHHVGAAYNASEQATAPAYPPHTTFPPSIGAMPMNNGGQPGPFYTQAHPLSAPPANYNQTLGRPAVNQYGK